MGVYPDFDVDKLSNTDTGNGNKLPVRIFSVVAENSNTT